MRRRGGPLTCLWVLWTLLTAQPVGAATLAVVGEPDNPHHQELVAALESRLQALGITAELRFDKEWPTEGEATVTVTVGTEAAQRYAAHGVTLHTLISQATFLRLYPAQRERVSALYIDQPVKRIVQFIAITLPERPVGALLGPWSRQQLSELQSATTAAGLALTTEEIDDIAQLDGAVARLASGGHTLLTLPDPTVVSAKSAKTLILGAYLRNAPIIGYSQAFVKAGALAAVYSTPAQLGAQAAEMVAPLLTGRTETLPPPTHPSRFSIAANYQVARSLGISLASEETLAHDLKAAERQQGE